MNRRLLVVLIALPYGAALVLGACSNDTPSSNDASDGAVAETGPNDAPTDAPGKDAGVSDSTVATAVTVSWGAECALMNDGTVRCWGPGPNLGLPYDASITQSTNRPTPVQVPGLAGINQIASSLLTTCALSNAGSVYCWGDNNKGASGVDGSDLFGIVYAPRQVSLPAAAYYIDVGYNGACARLVTGEVWCWGAQASSGVFATVTDGSAVPYVIGPTPMFGVTSPLSIGIGFNATCVIFDGGTTRCVGSNGNGELGTTSIPSSAIILNFDASAPAMLAGPGMSLGPTATLDQCVVLATGAVQCWGGNGFAIPAPLDAGTPVTTPQTIPTITNATAVSVGAGHACAIDGAGDVYCWGQNATGGLGAPLDSGILFYNPPYKVGLPSKAVGVSAGGDLGNSSCPYCGESCAVLDTGAIYCWGSNNRGRLGRGPDAGGVSADPNPAPVNF